MSNCEPHNIKTIPIKAIKQILAPQISKARAKEFIDIYTSSQKEYNKAIKNKSPIKEKVNSKSILDYDFLSQKQSNPADFFIEENELCNEKENKKEKYGLYEKFLAQKIIKDNRIEEEKIRKVQEEFNSVKQPLINQKSLLICSRSKTLSKPIYKRLKDIENKHNEKLIKIKMEVNKEQEEKEKASIDVHNNKYHSHHRSKVNFKEWLAENEQWDNQRQEKLKLKRSESASYLFEKDENCTYHPKINKRSKELIRRRENCSCEHIKDTSQRLYNTFFEYKERKKQLEKKYTPSFKPKINEGFVFKDYKTYTFLIEEQN